MFKRRFYVKFSWQQILVIFVVAFGWFVEFCRRCKIRVKFIVCHWVFWLFSCLSSDLVFIIDLHANVQSELKFFLQKVVWKKLLCCNLRVHTQYLSADWDYMFNKFSIILVSQCGEEVKHLLVEFRRVLDNHIIDKA